MNVTGLLTVAFGLIGQWLLGIRCARLLLEGGRHSSQGNTSAPPIATSSPIDPSISAAELAGVGIVMGIGVTAWSLFIWSFAGGELGILPSSALALLGFVLEGPNLVAWLRHRTAGPNSRRPATDMDRSEKAFCQACQSVILFLFVTTFIQTLQTPQKLWDERAIFAIKARVLFEDRSIRSPALFHADFVQYHPRYPLLLPLAEQNIYALLGTVDDRLSKILFTMLYVGLVLTTSGVLRRHLTRSQSWLAGLLMATIPVLLPYEYGFLCGQADAPTACFHGLSVLYLWDALTQLRRQMSRSGGSMLLGGFCGGFAAFTKDEGIAYLLIDGTILGLFALASLRRPGRFGPIFLHVILFVTATLSVLLPWFIHRRSLPNTTEMNYFGRMTAELFISRLETLRWSVPHLLHRMFWEWREWGLQWWLMLAAFLSRPLSSIRTPQVIFILDVAGSLAALLVAGMLAPAQLDEHIGGSSHRFLMQIAPVAVLFAVTTYFDVQRLASKETA